MEGSETTPFRVAIIGGGMSGASTAYYLREMFKNNVSITLFEKSGRIGGRMKSIEFAGNKYESGASIFHSSHQYMMRFTEQLGLDLSNSRRHLSVFGSEYKSLFSTIGFPLFIQKLVQNWYYGYNPIAVRLMTSSKLSLFEKVYYLQDTGNCFTTPGRLLEALSPMFIDMTKVTFDEWIKTNDSFIANGKLANELLFGFMSNNCCQSSNTVHAFAGFMSMTAMLSSFYSVQKGNEQVPSQLIEKALKDNPLSSDSKTFLNAEVTEIKNVIGPSQGYSLTYRDRDSNQLAKAEFDYVVLAAPLHQDSKLIGPENVKLPSIKYQSVDCSFFHGTLKSGAFGINTDSLSNGDSLFLLPSKSYYENHDGNLLRSFMRNTAYSNNQWTPTNVWSSFTDPKDMPNPLETLPKLFLNLLDNDRIDENKKSSKLVQWLAYPVYNPMPDPHQTLGSFELAPRMFYPNAIESLMSSMEMAAIGGRNVALLIAGDRLKLGHDKELHLNWTVNDVSPFGIHAVGLFQPKRGLIDIDPIVFNPASNDKIVNGSSSFFHIAFPN